MTQSKEPQIKRPTSDAPPSERPPLPGGLVIWIAGPLRERADLARMLRRGLLRSGHLAIVLRGEAVREASGSAYASTPRGDASFHETLAHLATLIADQGMVVVVSAALRSVDFHTARKIDRRFIEVLVEPETESSSTGSSKMRRSAVSSETSPELETPTSAEPDVVAHGREDDPAVPWLLDQVARRVA